MVRRIKGEPYFQPHKPRTGTGKTYLYHDEWLTISEIGERSTFGKFKIQKYMRQFGWNAEQIINGK